MRFSPILRTVAGVVVIALCLAGDAPAPKKLLQEAHKWRAEKSYKRAAEQAREFLAQFPNDPGAREARYLLGDSLRRIADWQQKQEAEKELKPLASSDVADIWRARAQVSLALLYVERGHIRPLSVSPKESLRITIEELEKTPEANKLFSAAEAWFEEEFAKQKTTALKEELGGIYLDHMRSMRRYWHEDRIKVTESLLQKVEALKPGAALESEALYLAGDITGKTEPLRRVVENYQNTEFWDDALYHLAQRLEGEQKFKDALKHFRMLTERFTPAESRFVKDAQQRIKNILAAAFDVTPQFIALPGTFPKVSFRWRNVNEVKFTLYQSEPFSAAPQGHDFGAFIRATRGAEVKSWSRKLEDSGEHLWYNSEEEIEIAKPGAYQLEANATGAGGTANRSTWLLVTRAVAVTKCSGPKIVAFIADSRTGEPLGNAQLKLHWQEQTGNKLVWRSLSGKTDDGGLCTFELPKERHSNQFILLAKSEEHYAFSLGWSAWYAREGGYGMGYVYTDRPAYRPKETVHFKAILRQYDGAEYHTVANQTVNVEIYDPRGSKLFDKSIVTNEFGTLNGSLDLAERPPLGQYSIRIQWYNGNAHGVFRVEEYKLPEFEVKVSTDKPLYRLGDKLGIKISAEYYFGGPVAEADATVIVYRVPHYHWYRPVRRYSWYFHDIDQPWGRHWWPRHGRTFVKQATLKTDANGQCTLEVETPKEVEQPYFHGYTFDVEARVVDKSRREITGHAAVKVTKDPFYVFVHPRNYLYYPGDRVELEIKAENANGEPVATIGNMRIQKAEWSEEKKDYLYKPVLTEKLFIGETGKAEFAFVPDEEGYFKMEMIALTPAEEKVTGEAWVHVASKEKGIIGYRHAGVQIVTDKDTYSRGDTAHVLLTTQFPASFVLFGVEAEQIHSIRLIHVKGNATVFDLPIAAEFIPNVFLTAYMVRENMLWTHQRQIICPPDEKFIEVSISAPKQTFQPGEQANFTIKTTDKNGKPVPCEVSLGLVDASVYYIQSEYAQDIRQFFYGRKRGLQVSTHSTFNWMRYHGKGIVPPAEEPVDEKEGLRRERQLGYADGLPQDRRKAARGGAGEGEMLAAAAAPPMFAEAKALRAAKEQAADKVDEAAEQFAPATVRSDFRATAFWQPSVITGEDGTAVVSVKFPDSLTMWRATARAVTRETRVGNITHDTRTKKNIMCRLQCPRFFMERDRVVLSAVINNYLPTEKKVRVSIDPSGLVLRDAATKTVSVPKDGEARVDWWCEVTRPGNAEITVIAQSDEESDAMRKSFAIYPHGVEKFVAFSDRVRDAVTESLFLPPERNPGATSLEITLSPSIASAMLDSLDYLAQYPYGCTEQTMSRFLPSVIVAKTLRDLGLARPALEEKLPKMVQAGLDRLYSFQSENGSWGWWKHDSGNPWMTSYVLYGLTMAQRAGYQVEEARIQRAIQWLRQNMVQHEEQMDTLAYMQYALSYHNIKEQKWLERVWQRRDELNAYTRALLALTFHNLGDAERAKIMLRNMEDLVQEDKAHGTAHWGRSGVYYRWSEGGIEATSYALKAYMAIDPQNRLVDPLMKWLVQNRRGNRWKSTRDTAIAVYALADYVRVTKELAPDYTVRVLLNGKPIKEVKVDKENALSFENKIRLADADLLPGANTLKIERQGTGALYYSAYLTYYTKEEDITGAGSEIFVKRTYTKTTLLPDGTVERTPLASGAKIRSGDRIEVKLEIEAKNNYEYIVFEDMKPSGCEPTQLRSGYAYGGLWSNMELRDELVAFFISHMPQGKHTLTYELRAEVPGEFHTMPTRGFAMYVPEIRCISDEWRATIGEKE